MTIARRLYLVLGIMLLLISAELCALLFTINTLSAVRAYVAGEGLWSKAEKDAAYHLEAYGRTLPKSIRPIGSVSGLASAISKPAWSLRRQSLTRAAHPRDSCMGATTSRTSLG